MIYQITDRQGRTVKVKATSEPRKHAEIDYWYVDGFRWIKSKQKWSGTELVHSGVEIKRAA